MAADSAEVVQYPILYHIILHHRIGSYQAFMASYHPITTYLLIVRPIVGLPHDSPNAKFFICFFFN